jgi:hypothetical protein
MHDKIFPTKFYYGDTFLREFALSDSCERLTLG